MGNIIDLNKFSYWATKFLYPDFSRSYGSLNIYCCKKLYMWKKKKILDKINQMYSSSLAMQSLYHICQVIHTRLCTHHQQYMHAAFKKCVVGDFSDAQSKAWSLLESIDLIQVLISQPSLFWMQFSSLCTE